MNGIRQRAANGQFSVSKHASGRIILSVDTFYFDNQDADVAASTMYHLSEEKFQMLRKTLNELNDLLTFEND